jgi:hypothetical protein
MKQIVNNLIELEREIELAEQIFDKKAAEAESATREMAELQKDIHDLNKKRHAMHGIILERIKAEYEDDDKKEKP